jgi:preprotein translocase subunit YajC
MYIVLSTATFQYAQEAQAQQGMSIISIVFFMGMLFLLYQFMVAKPMKKEKDQHSKMINSLIKGDKIVTIGGIHGEIVEIQESVIVLKTGNNSTCTLNKTAIKLKFGAENA